MSPTISIHYYIHGRGRGHASRSLPIIAALRADGHRVTVYAGQDAQALMDQEPQGATAVESVPTGAHPSVAALIARRVRSARAAIAQERPSILISDGDLPSSVAARIAKVPSVAIGHGLVFGYCRRVPGAAPMPWWRERLKARLAAAGADRQVAVNFAPVTPMNAVETIVARPTLRPSLREDATRRANSPVGPHTLCYFRDDNGDAIAEDLAAAGHRPVLFTKRSGLSLKGVRVQPQSRVGFAEALLSARAVISSAGSQLISECVALGIPQFAMYSADDDEQRLNVSMLRHFGLGDGESFQGYRRASMARFMDRCDLIDSSATPVGSDGAGMPPLDAVAAMRRAVASLL